MINPFTDSEFEHIGAHEGFLVIRGTNSRRNQALECKHSDWFLFWGKDENLKTILSLKSDEEIKQFSEDAATKIRNSKMPAEQKKIYASLYMGYMHKVLPAIKKFSHRYEYIRVFYNKMDDYAPV